MLRDAGMIAQNVYSRDDIDLAYGYSDESTGQPVVITLEPCVLIDDLRPNMVGMQAKKKALPNARHLQIVALTTRPTGGLGSPQELAYSDLDDDAKSLAECLDLYRRMG